MARRQQKPLEEELEIVSFEPLSDDDIVGQESVPRPPVQGGALKRLIKGTAETALPTDTLSDVWEGPKYMFGSPSQFIDSLKLIGGSIYDASANQAGQAKEAFNQGRPLAAAGHALGALPVVGPMGAEVTAKVQEGDLAGALGNILGVVGPGKFGPKVRAGKVAGGNTPRTMQAAATEKFTQFAAPSQGPNVRRFTKQAEKHAPTVLRDPDMSALTLDDFKFKVEDKLVNAQSGLDAAHNARIPATARYDTKSIIRTLDKQIERLTAKPIEGSRAERKVVERQSSIVDESGRPITVAEPQTQPFGKDVTPAPNVKQVEVLARIRSEVAALGPSATYEALRRIREGWDKTAKAKYLRDNTSDLLRATGEADAAEKGTRVLRDFLAKRDPVTNTANADYHLWRSMNEVVEAAKAPGGRPKRLLTGVLNRTAGALAGSGAAYAHGNPMAIIAGYMAGHAIEKAASSGLSTKLLIARKYQTLADALRGGNTGQISAALKAIERTLTAGRNVGPGTAARASAVAGAVNTGAQDDE